MKKLEKELKAMGPKRAKTSYMWFTIDKRPEVVKADPSLSATEIVSRLGELWRELSDEDKEEYQEKAVADKERYAEEMANYVVPAALTRILEKRKAAREEEKRAAKRVCKKNDLSA